MRDGSPSSVVRSDSWNRSVQDRTEALPAYLPLAIRVMVLIN